MHRKSPPFLRVLPAVLLSGFAVGCANVQMTKIDYSYVPSKAAPGGGYFQVRGELVASQRKGDVLAAMTPRVLWVEGKPYTARQAMAGRNGKVCQFEFQVEDELLHDLVPEGIRPTEVEVEFEDERGNWSKVSGTIPARRRG